MQKTTKASFLITPHKETAASSVAGHYLPENQMTPNSVFCPSGNVKDNIMTRQPKSMKHSPFSRAYD